jgi:hypothetical protein
MQIVHIIPAPGMEGDRHEERFADDVTAEQILDALTKPRVVANGRVAPPLQDGYGLLKDGRGYLDHPESRVVIGRVENRQFVEVKTIFGPPPKLDALHAANNPSVN